MFKRWNPRRDFALFAILLVGLLGIPAVQAQEEGGEVDLLRAIAEEAAPAKARPRQRVIEEIVVTAQKTEQSLQDVPISISVLDEEFLHQKSVTDFRDVSLYVPNTAIDNAAFAPDIRIRGFGSALTNKAFEQSVGLVLDGIPYGKLPYWQGPLFDLERVEVLRGPQGTLFGKNTTAGVVNIVTKKPTEDFTVSIDGDLGELDRRRLEVGAGGPIVPGLVNVRLSGLLDERDGILANTTARVAPRVRDRMNGREREAVRAQVGLPSVLGASIVVGYEHVRFSLFGAGFELRQLEDGIEPFFRLYDPDVDIEPDNFIGSIDGPPGLPERRTVEMDSFVVNAHHDLGPWRLDLVGGYSQMEAYRQDDSDWTPAPMFWILDDRDRHPQATFELRLTSPSLPGLVGLDRLLDVFLGSSDFTTGFFFQRRRMDSQLPIWLNVPTIAQFLAFQGNPAGGVEPIENFIGPAVAVGDRGTFDTRQGNESETTFFEETLTTFAGFGQLNWRPADRWTLQSGMRLTAEQKKANWELIFTEGTGLVFAALAGFEEYTAEKSRSELELTPKVSLTFDWTDDVSAFASWAKGFKAGGFNELSPNATDELLSFEPEKAMAWELGTKARLLDGTAFVNLTLFRQDVTDLQVFTVNPTTLLSSVENAGKSRAQGVEADIMWLPTDWLTLMGSLGLNDSEFIEFPFGECAGDRENTDGDDDLRCDHSGQPLFRTPKWTSSVTPSVRVPLDSIPPSSWVTGSWIPGIDLIGDLTIEYQDVQFVGRSFDPRTRQPSFFRLSGSIGIGNEAQGWSARLVAENLTNTVANVQVRDVTLGQGTLVQLPEEPRLLFGSFRWVF